MRSFLIVGGLMLVVGLVFVKGLVPKQAEATSSKPDPNRGEIVVEYADFESEAPPVFSTRVAEPDPEPEFEAPAEAAEPELTRTPPVETAEPAAADPAPDLQARDDIPDVVANAGEGQTVWLGDNEIKLDGSASVGGGLRYAWRQVSGPGELTIADPTAEKTTASGFPTDGDTSGDASYEFELTTTDFLGKESTATVRYKVKTAPALTIRPRAKQQLAYRDGYLLAHFEAWKTNRSDYAETFEVRSSSELTFQQLSGAAEYEISVSEARRGLTYQVTIYYPEDGSSSWLEFFVDTAEHIPAVLQFGVNWE